MRASKKRVRVLLRAAWQAKEQLAAEEALKILFRAEYPLFKPRAWEKLKAASKRLRFALAARASK